VEIKTNANKKENEQTLEDLEGGNKIKTDSVNKKN
jgi:hypothetical protein